MSARAKRPWAEDIRGKSFVLFGDIPSWPASHGADPAIAVHRRGGILRDEVDEALDYLVLGSGRQKGKAAAEKKGRALLEARGKPAILDSAGFVHLMRLDLKGTSFYFTGGFDFCPPDFEAGQPPALVASFGGVVAESITPDLDFFVAGNRRGAGKTADLRAVKKLNDEGADILVLSEEDFLQIVGEQASPSAKSDLPGLIAALQGVVDRGRLKRALDMLKKESFSLYADVDDAQLVGVVRSQTDASKLYSSRLGADGAYNCCDQQLAPCMGLQGQLCKHLLVLVLGLVQSGGVDTPRAQAWIGAATRKRPSNDQQPLADTLLRYRAAEAGEIDWRPTETVPEDFYAY